MVLMRLPAGLERETPVAGNPGNGVPRWESLSRLSFLTWADSVMTRRAECATVSRSRYRLADTVMLAIMAEFADACGYFQMTIRDVMAVLGRSERTIQFALRRLETAGLITLVKATNGGRFGNTYRMNVRPTAH